MAQIHAYAERGDLAGVGRTLAEGADVNAREPARGRTPLMLAAASTTPLMEAVETGAVEAVRLLLEAGVRVDQTDQFGQPALAKASNLEIARLLFAAGADLNAVTLCTD